MQIQIQVQIQNLDRPPDPYRADQSYFLAEMLIFMRTALRDSRIWGIGGLFPMQIQIWWQILKQKSEKHISQPGNGGIRERGLEASIFPLLVLTGTDTFRSLSAAVWKLASKMGDIGSQSFGEHWSTIRWTIFNYFGSQLFSSIGLHSSCSVHTNFHRHWVTSVWFESFQTIFILFILSAITFLRNDFMKSWTISFWKVRNAHVYWESRALAHSWLSGQKVESPPNQWQALQLTANLRGT